MWRKSEKMVRKSEKMWRKSEERSSSSTNVNSENVGESFNMKEKINKFFFF
jgi:hypothetical protein